MGWISVIWLMIAVASATVAMIHAYAWTRLRHAPAHGAFTVCAAGVSMVALVELGIMGAGSVDEVGRLIWLQHFPVWLAIVGCVLFVRFHMRAGRPWLAWTAIGLRSLVLVLNIFSSPNLNFREIHAISQMQVLGEAVTIARGKPNPLILLGLISVLSLAWLIVDAAVEVWRRGERRLAWTVGGLLFIFVLVAAASAVLRLFDLIRFPAVITLSCVPIVLAMGYEVSRELARAAQLSASLRERHAELSESDASLQLAADAANVALWSVDTASGELWVTAKAADLFGVGPDRPLADFMARIHPADRERVDAAMFGAASGREASVEYRVILPGDEERWYSTLGGAQQGGRGPSSVVTGVTIDVTARRRAELESQRRRLELDRLTRVSNAREFSSAMAHELGQPLAIIMSNAEAALGMLRRPEPDRDELQAMFADIIAADERANKVLARLRSLPRRGELAAEVFALNPLVDGVLDVMREELVRRGVAVHAGLPAGLRPVAGDHLLIEQLLFNLLRNACEAMEDTPAGQRRLSISTAAVGGMAEISICDTGAGLPANTAQIFQPYYTTKPEGLGVGLAICSSIAEAHGGDISARPNEGQGASFRVRLPFAPDGTAAEEAA